MATGSRSLLAGLIAGLCLAFLLQEAVVYLPNLSPTAERSLGSDTPIDSMARLLRNSLQMARQAVRPVGYKSIQVAPSSSLLQHTASTSPTTTRAFSSTTAAAMASQKPFLQAVKERRTFYQLNKEAPISDKAITALVKEAVVNVPSSFNSQSARLVVLLNKEHDTFWDMVKDVLKPMVPPEQWSHTEQRVAGFKAAYGSILFFEDPEPVEALRKAFPIYAHHFGDWSEHTSAMHQFMLWVALEAEGFGANLQHYNPIIDQKAQKHWKIPLEWKLRAQLVFGGRAGEPGEKEVKPVEGQRLFVHGAKE